MLTVDISGFGGSYEMGCQKMLLNGMRFLGDNPRFDWEGYKSYKGVYGLCIAENEDAKRLDEAICVGVEPSGAMHHAVVSHLIYIHKYGYDNWIACARENGMTIYKRQTEDEIDMELLIAQIEWKMKLDNGYNPLAEMMDSIPPENIISYDPKDPDSISGAARRAANIIREHMSQ